MTETENPGVNNNYVKSKIQLFKQHNHPTKPKYPDREGIALGDLIKMIISDTKKACKRDIHENWQEPDGSLTTPYAIRAIEIIVEAEVTG